MFVVAEIQQDGDMYNISVIFVFKIFGYLNIQEVRLSAQVSHQFNIISKDSSLKPELLIEQKKSP